MSPYHHYLDTTDDVQHIIDAVAQMVPDFNKDTPEAATQAIYSVITGNGLGDLVPNRGRVPFDAGRTVGISLLPPRCPSDHPCCFPTPRCTTGPRLASPTYGNPPYDGILGLGTRLPPVEQSPNVLYSSDPFTAWNLGDLRRQVADGDGEQYESRQRRYDMGQGCLSARQRVLGLLERWTRRVPQVLTERPSRHVRERRRQRLPTQPTSRSSMER